MRLRHKQPTLVSMWMLDVFCCALGCVILLLLLKMREASFTASEAMATDSALNNSLYQLDVSEMERLLTSAALNEREADLTFTQTQRNELAQKLALVQKERDEQARVLALVQKERDEQAHELALLRRDKDVNAKKLALAEKTIRLAEDELALVKDKVKDNARMLALVQNRITDNQKELARKQSDIDQLSKQLSISEKDRESLQTLVRDKEKIRAEALRQTLDYNDRLVAAEIKLQASEKRLKEMMAQSLSQSKLNERITELEKKLADSNVTIVDLQGTKAKLADKINKIELDNEQKFAGIALTGKNVIFVVDISGSMIRTDENTLDLKKWPIVCDSVAKVMRSLPTLERFQVIVFSNKVNYLLGADRSWILYEKEKSITKVKNALLATKVNGDTNLHQAFAEAFSYRDRTRQLDTIYLFSDGLPTSGPGLTSVQETANLTESERSVILARYLRTRLKNDWNRYDVDLPRVRINSIGFFYESPDVGAFLWALSRENDGSFVGMSRP